MMMMTTVNLNPKTLILKDSRSIWTYPTASPCYTANTNKHDYTTNIYYETDTDRQTDRQTGRQAGRQADRDRQTETETETDRQRQTDRDRETDRQTQRDRQTDRETQRDRQKQRETDREINARFARGVGLFPSEG